MERTEASNVEIPGERALCCAAGTAVLRGEATLTLALA